MGMPVAITYNVIITSDYDKEEKLAKVGAINQMSTWAFARGIRWANGNLFNFDPGYRVFVVTYVDGREVDKTEV